MVQSSVLIVAALLGSTNTEITESQWRFNPYAIAAIADEGPPFLKSGMSSVWSPLAEAQWDTKGLSILQTI